MKENSNPLRIHLALVPSFLLFILYLLVMPSLLIAQSKVTRLSELFLNRASQTQVSFSYSPANPASGQDVQFVDTSTNGPTSWLWNFGDGTTSTAQNPSHAFSRAGFYRVSLTASKNAGSKARSRTIIVTASASASSSIASAASFKYTPSAPVVGQMVQFTDTSTNSPTSWQWHFGDGMTSTVQNPTHSYGASGPFVVTLDAGSGSGTKTASQTLTVSSASTVTASFTYSPALPLVGQTVQFTDTSSGSPTSWHWSFGDGGTSTAQNPSYTFAAAASYITTLTASNATGSRNTSQSITIVPALSASFTYSPVSPATGQAIQFTDTSTGSPSSWQWDFGDGTSSTAQNPSHSFSASGSYSVSLTIRAGSNLNNASQTVKVGQQLAASFNYSPASPAVGQAVQFTDVSTGSPTSWQWDFGDGTTNSNQNPSHAYAASGSYSVSLTIWSGSTSASTSGAINVGSGMAYWVSPTGAALYANAYSAIPLSGTACCSLATANANAKAGDTIILRGGTYVLTSVGQVGIGPLNRGASINARITFCNYDGEIPVIKGAGGYDVGYGIDISCGVGSGIGTYIHITGITFQNCARWATLRNYANYNEIDHCRFYSDTGEDVVSPFKICGLAAGGSRRDAYSTHNWIHDNTFSKAHKDSTDPAVCYEGRDIFRIGDPQCPSFPEDQALNNNNSFENNYVEHAGHTCYDSYGQYIVVKNNVMHNEPWYVSDDSTASYSNHGYSNPAYIGKYGHRVMQVTNDLDRRNYNLIEGNRLGFGSPNPNNNGADCLDIAAPYNIIRFNRVFGAMNSGIMFKYGYSNAGHGGSYNRLYNNTLFHNGYGNPWYESNHQPQNNTSPEALLNIRFYQSDTTGNIIKNNLLYQSRRYELSSFEIGGGEHDSSAPAGSAITNNWLTSNGDPKFSNPDLSDPTSSTLPDLTLQASSGAIGQGTYLTQASGAGSNSTALVVNDALYFQDGTWGSYLARASTGLGGTFQPDWIAIGTVDNVVQIQAINYTTNTITLALPMTWTGNAPIWLYKNSSGERVLYGTAPDLGAHPVVR